MHGRSLSLAVDSEFLVAVGLISSQGAETPASWEQSLEELLDRFLPEATSFPQTLHRAMRYAVFSGGRRVRPRLALQVAAACGAGRDDMELVMRLTCALELIHAGSLVHDDLPCFDDAAERRGQPAVHVQFGVPMAVLTGDALLTLAFEVLAEAPDHLAKRAMQILRLLCRATGSVFGIIGGQSLEQPSAECGTGALPLCSPELIERYHQMKTGALFQLATEAAAVAAGASDPAAWSRVGLMIGSWYQLADDLLDVRGQSAALGKPVGQDAALGRPNAASSQGEERVREELQGRFEEIRRQVQPLTAQPQHFLAFLESLRAHVQQILTWGQPCHRR